MKKKLLSAILAASMATAMLAGCGSSSSGSDTAATAASASGEAATATDTAASGAGAAIDSISVVSGSEDGAVLDTAKSGTLQSFSEDRHLYEGLYKLDQDGNPVLGQAANVETSDDGLTWTFTLRDDITWSDGQAVKASDFTYAWQRLAESGQDYSSLLSMIKDTETPDDKTIVITLNYPCAYLPSVLAFPSSYPVRQDYAEKYGDAYATDPDKAVYNGAYTLSDWTHQQELVMTKRDDYYDASNITVGEIHWELMSDATTALASYQSGDVIYSDLVPDEEVENLEGQGLQYAPGYMTYTVMFNLKSGNEVLQNADVRKALSLAIDRQRVVDLRSMNDELADTYTPSGMTGSDGTDFTDTVTPWFDNSTYEDNCKEAQDLLAKAGYSGDNFPTLTYLVSNSNTQEVAESIVGDWSSVLGINSITVSSSDSFFSSRENGDYDLAYFGWYMDYPDISNILGTMVTGANDAGYSSDEYDAAYDAAIAESDPTKQWEDYAKCEDILSNDLPITPILHGENKYLFDDTNYGGLIYYCGNAYFGYLTQN